MQPDLELRELIATKLMGRRVHWLANASDFWYEVTDPAEYTTTGALPHFHERDGRVPAYELEIGPAFQAVEAMRARGYVFCYLSSVPVEDGFRHKCRFSKRTPLGRKSAKDYEGADQHLPRAIALAIRAALEMEGA